jgi:hypothetical protein
VGTLASGRLYLQILDRNAMTKLLDAKKDKINEGWLRDLVLAGQSDEIDRVVKVDTGTLEPTSMSMNEWKMIKAYNEALQIDSEMRRSALYARFEKAFKEIDKLPKEVQDATHRDFAAQFAATPYASGLAERRHNVRFDEPSWCAGPRSNVDPDKKREMLRQQQISAEHAYGASMALGA